MLELFPDELIVTHSSDNTVTLTTHRICKQEKEWGKSYNQSIMLEHITSCENSYNSHKWILIIGGICVVLGILGSSNNNSSGSGFAIIIGLILVGFYYLTKRNFITIASPSTKMQIKVTGMKQEQVLSFINKVEQTKNKRLTELNNSHNMTC